jgi:hypothetical protein
MTRTAMVFLAGILCYSSFLKCMNFDPFWLAPKRLLIPSEYKIILSDSMSLKYDQKHHEWIATKLNDARRQAKMFIISKKRLPYKDKSTIDKIHTEYAIAAELNPEDYISISEDDVYFETVQIEPMRIVGAQGFVGLVRNDYKPYLIPNEGRFYLTPQQSKWLETIKENAITTTRVTVNLTALKNPEIYAKFFDPKKLIEPCDMNLIN